MNVLGGTKEELIDLTGVVLDVERQLLDMASTPLEASIAKMEHGLAPYFQLLCFKTQYVLTKIEEVQCRN